MSEPKVFKTTVRGIGPWCVEFSDGELVTCRTEQRAKAIAGIVDHDMLAALHEVSEYLDGVADVVDGDDGQPAPNKAMRLKSEVDAAIARAEALRQSARLP